MPMEVLPEGNYEVGQDVTEILGIKKIEDVSLRRERPTNEIRLAQAHRKLVKKPWFKYLMRYEWLRKLAYKLLLPKKKTPKFPTQFEGVSKTDEERCVVGNTKVLTDKGFINISKIVNQKLNVKVLSMNSDGTLSYKRILDYQKYKTRLLL